MFKYFKKYLIVIIEKKNDKKIEIIFNLVIKKLSEISRFLKPNTETAPKIGIEIKKDILAESVLLKFNSLAAVIPIPALLTPGINDNIWSTPMNNADLKEKSLLIFLITLNLSLIYNKIAKIKVVQAINSRFLIFN